MDTWFAVLVQAAVLVGVLGLVCTYLKDTYDRVWVCLVNVLAWGTVQIWGWIFGGYAWLFGWAS